MYNRERHMLLLIRTAIEVEALFSYWGNGISRFNLLGTISCRPKIWKHANSIIEILEIFIFVVYIRTERRLTAMWVTGLDPFLF